jgi:HMG (high mobility group) box
MAKYTGPMHVPNKRIKKPLGAPKRAMSSFLSFSQLMRPEIRLQYPNMKNTDVSSVLADKWHEATEEEKRPHIERELKDREKYHEDMARWKEDEHDRLEASKAQRAADQAAMDDAARLQSSLTNSNPSQQPFPSIWAAMIAVNETGDTGSASPLFDEAMDGFWDIDEEDVEGLVPCDGVTTRPSANAFPAGSGSETHSIRFPDSSSQHSLAKSQRLVKRAKDRKFLETANSSHINMMTPGEVAPTARQLEVLQRRQQQQQQYQMYQQHILNQRHKTDKCKDDPDPFLPLAPSSEPKLGMMGWDASRGTITTPGNIVETGPLQAQTLASQRQASVEAQLQYQQPGYQGLQRTYSSRSVEWSNGLFDDTGAVPQTLRQPPIYAPNYSKGRNENMFYEPPSSASSSSATLNNLPSFHMRPQLPATSSPQPMSSFQFDEQDQLSVMQTLMAVHRASASKAGDSETLRSLDRIQMAHRQAQSTVKAQQPGLGQDNHAGLVRVGSQQQLHVALASSSIINNNNNPYECAPLSVQQQERQNQTERKQLTDRQNKQMKDMVLLQQREQAEQNHQHSFSLVSASTSSYETTPSDT